MRWNGTHHETNFKEIGSDTHEDMDLAEEIKIEGAHPIVVGDAGEEVHEDQLTVALAPIPRFLVRSCLLFRSTLHDDDGGRSSARDGYPSVKTAYPERRR